MTRRKITLELLAAVEGADLERIKDLCGDGNLRGIIYGMKKDEVVEFYHFLGTHGMASEQTSLYDLATRYDHSAAQDLIEIKHFSRI